MAWVGSLERLLSPPSYTPSLRLALWKADTLFLDALSGRSPRVKAKRTGVCPIGHVTPCLVWPVNRAVTQGAGTAGAETRGGSNSHAVEGTVLVSLTWSGHRWAGLLISWLLACAESPRTMHRVLAEEASGGDGQVREGKEEGHSREPCGRGRPIVCEGPDYPPPQDEEAVPGP